MEGAANGPLRRWGNRDLDARGAAGVLPGPHRLERGRGRHDLDVRDREDPLWRRERRIAPEGLESILGTREVRTKSRSVSLQGNSTQLGIERLPELSVDELHRIPTGYGVLAYKNKRGVLLEMPGWTKRAHADEISAGKKQTEAEQADEFRRQGRLMPQPLQLEAS